MPRDTIKPIPECEFCCVPPRERRGGFHQGHPKCDSCGIFMGAGHVEPISGFCSTCSRTRQREAALR